MLQRFFEYISFSRENSNGTYRVDLYLRVLATFSIQQHNSNPYKNKIKSKLDPKAIYKHQSAELGCEMKFAVYVPPGESKSHVLYYLSGLTCNEQNCIQKENLSKLKFYYFSRKN